MFNLCLPIPSCRHIKDAWYVILERLFHSTPTTFVSIAPKAFPEYKMKLQLIVTLLPVVLPLAHGAPARRDTPNPGLRGTDSLVGYSPDNSGGSVSRPDLKYTLLPGQKEDPEIGSHLDFVKADNPQPIRGDTGSDDPGPSTTLFTTMYYLVIRLQADSIVIHCRELFL
jgi:hypothetical protein